MFSTDTQPTERSSKESSISRKAVLLIRSAANSQKFSGSSPSTV